MTSTQILAVYMLWMAGKQTHISDRYWPYWFLIALILLGFNKFFE